MSFGLLTVFEEEKKKVRTVVLCVFQRQHCFLGLARPRDNVLPFVRDCFIDTWTGRCQPSRSREMLGAPYDVRTTYKVENGHELLMMILSNSSSPVTSQGSEFGRARPVTLLIHSTVGY